MLAVISPAKSLDFESSPVTNKYTMPEFLPQAVVIIEKLRKLNPARIEKLMGISPKLAQLNYERYLVWHQPFSPENSKQAVLAFNGDVYQGLVAQTMTEEQLMLAQRKLRILSGLYGVLKPLDLIQPYRLEMGTKLPVGRKKNLYAFWKQTITNSISSAIADSGSNYLINLASNEYFRSIDTQKLEVPIITPEFKDMKNGTYKMISFFAKKARGLMARFIIENNLNDPQDLQAFDDEGYLFNPRLSKGEKLVFTRE